ncbi:MAG: DUF4097 family beta strand repeat protein [Undibacterium sp.]|nr:DUF4097 family beta strand repeat protein [Opitutaceae bacterium]
MAVRPAVAVERTVKRSFPVQPGATLKVDSYRGGIIVEETEESAVRVEVRVEVATEDEAQANQSLGALKLEMELVGNEVRVRAWNPRESRALFVWEEKRQIELTFRVFVPRSSSLDLSTLDGGVTVGNLTGRVVAYTRAGTISCRKIDGTIKATVDTGDIVVSRCTGAVDLRVQRGNIRTGTIFGRADVSSDSGDIEVLSALGGVTARTSAGDVAVGFQKKFAGESKIEASGGSIFVKVDPMAALTLDATTSWGRVQTTLPFAVEAGGAGKSKFTGKLNGGGPAVRLHAAGGQVKLDAYKQFLDLNEES